MDSTAALNVDLQQLVVAGVTTPGIGLLRVESSESIKLPNPFDTHGAKTDWRIRDW